MEINEIVECEVGQIVQGYVCGTFIILGFYMNSGEQWAKLKCVNEDDHTVIDELPLALPTRMLKPLA